VWGFLLIDLVNAFGHKSLERNLCVVVNTTDLDWTINVDTSLLKFTLFLELSQSARLFELLLTSFALCFLTLGIGESGSALLKHLPLVLIHVNWVGSARLRLGIRIDLSGSQSARVIWVCNITTHSPV